MKREAAREIAMHISFELAQTDKTVDELLAHRFSEEYYSTLAGEEKVYSQLPDPDQMDYISRIARGLAEHAYELDSYIEKYAKGWHFERISRTALAVMRLAMYEILYMPDIPDAVAINEAVELSKKYEEKEAVGFINGILGTFAREEKR